MKIYAIIYDGVVYCNRCKKKIGLEQNFKDTFQFCDECRPEAISWTLAGLKNFYDDLAKKLGVE